ncbi:MAG: peptidylprolyl isomerase [Acidobacteriota bacterium]
MITASLFSQFRRLAAFVTVAIAVAATSGAAGQTTPQGPAAGAGNQAVSPPADPGAFPAVVAAVNESSISREELISRVESIRAQMNLPGGALPLSIYRSVLDELINIELLYQAAQQAGLAASDEEVEADLADLKSRFPNAEAFEQELAAESMTVDQLKAILRKDLSVQKFVEQKLASAAQVSDADVRSFYDEHQAEFRQPEQVRLRHILLRVPQDATPEQRRAVRARLLELRKQIVDGGADFGALAREHSEDPGSKAQGGELVVGRGQTVEAFESAVFALGVGEVSDVVETPYGLHLVKVEEKIPARTVSFEELAPRIREYLERDKTRAQVELEVERLRQGAAIQVFL